MAEEALPCIICGKKLRNVFSESHNQPGDGTSFISYGQYGSTMFDPMDGTFIEINICDECVKKKAEEEKILVSRKKRPVLATFKHETPKIPVLIGWTKGEVPYVTWKPGLAGMSDTLEIFAEDLEDETFLKHFETTWSIEMLKSQIESLE